MKKRGKILRDPRFGHGLLMVEGQQYPFLLEGVWRSKEAPRPGLVVDVETDSDGKIRSITVVPESDLAREQPAGQRASPRRKGGISRPSATAHRLWAWNVTAVAVLALTWYLLTAVSVETPLLGRVDLTFWELLSLLNTGDLANVPNQGGNPGVGIYGALAVAALLGPILQQLWTNRRAALGGFLPLFFMLFVGIAARGHITRVGGVPADAFSSAQGIRQQAVTPISLSFGGYLSVTTGIFLASVSAKRLVSLSARGQESIAPTQKRAA